MIENFAFNDLVLYAKGWYKRTDLLSDLGYIFGNIYAWVPTTEEEIARLMLMAIDELYTQLGMKFDSQHYGRYRNSFSAFYDEIGRRMKLYNLSFNMAIILFGLSIFAGLERSLLKLNPPHFGKKEHFRLGMMLGEYPISQTYTEMNRIVNNFFKEDTNETI